MGDAAFAVVVRGTWTVAVTWWCVASLAEARGVRVRQRGVFGVVRAQAGSWTRRRRVAQSPPYASLNAE